MLLTNICSYLDKHSKKYKFQNLVLWATWAEIKSWLDFYGKSQNKSSGKFSFSYLMVFLSFRSLWLVPKLCFIIFRLSIIKDVVALVLVMGPSREPLVGPNFFGVLGTIATED